MYQRENGQHRHWGLTRMCEVRKSTSWPRRAFTLYLKGKETFSLFPKLTLALVVWRGILKAHNKYHWKFVVELLIQKVLKYNVITFLKKKKQKTELREMFCVDFRHNSQ